MDKQPLKVEVNKLEEVAVVKLAASFYTSNSMAQQLKSKIQELLDEGIKHIVVNMAEVVSIDSEGLGVLSFGYKSCHNDGGNFVICDLNNRDVADVIEIVNLDKIIHIYPTEKEALEKIK
jgi:anti-anti-sigma factor